jgi:hypothetical protein
MMKACCGRMSPGEALAHLQDQKVKDAKGKKGKKK